MSSVKWGCASHRMHPLRPVDPSAAAVAHDCPAGCLGWAGAAARTTNEQPVHGGVNPVQPRSGVMQGIRGTERAHGVAPRLQGRPCALWDRVPVPLSDWEWTQGWADLASRASRSGRTSLPCGPQPSQLPPGQGSTASVSAPGRECTMRSAYAYNRGGLEQARTTGKPCKVLQCDPPALWPSPRSPTDQVSAARLWSFARSEAL